MRWWTAIAVAAALSGGVIARSVLQAPAVRSVDEQVLREYAGVYQWDTQGFLYLQLWNEFTGTNALVAFEESGDVRVLYPTDRDRFFAGAGAALKTSIESRVEFQRESAGRIASLSWQRQGSPARTARRVAIERHEDVRFANGDTRLAGTLIRPDRDGKYAAIVLVHASGAADRGQVLPLARFLVRHGIALLAYDKRGVGDSTGDWNAASFDELAGDVVAAFEYLKTRADIDPAQIGLLGWSQAGWIMPLAAAQAKDLAFVISVSGAGVPAAETTIDQTQNELTARGLKPQTIADIVAVMKLQYRFARTGQGWDEYAAARGKLAARIGAPPESLPGTPDHPSWHVIRRLYFYDPAPALRQLQAPVLALFGELDNNIVAEKNAAAWETALKAGGNRDYTLRILPKANHLQLEAKAGSNAEMASLQRFVPEYATTVQEWLARRIRGFGATR
jgi:pimeloyl-ACP methyl ester carboxylesterase